MLRFWVSPGLDLFSVPIDESDDDWIEENREELTLPSGYEDGSPQLENLTTWQQLVGLGYARVSLHDNSMFITTSRRTPWRRILDVVWKVVDAQNSIDLTQVSVSYLGEDNFTRLMVYTNREWF